MLIADAQSKIDDDDDDDDTARRKNSTGVNR